MRIGKRELLARFCASLHLTDLVETLPKRNVLMVLNYHRIGSADQTLYDSAVFSATAEQFDEQIGYLKQRFHMATLKDALDIVQGRGPDRASVLITFDDGYLDNYTTAFPLLRSHGVQGVFFLPTAFIGTRRLPWWESIAYLVKNTRASQIELGYPEPLSVNVNSLGVEASTNILLKRYKAPSMTDPERFLQQLEEACRLSRPTENAERCFLGWDEARQMLRAGMAFGSHTHTHPILARLDAAQQLAEFRLSRQILEQQLGRTIDVLAYPVGSRSAFSPASFSGLETAGYRAAFSYYGGLNRPGAQRFDIRRESVAGQSHHRLRLHLSMSAVAGTGCL